LNYLKVHSPTATIGLFARVLRGSSGRFTAAICGAAKIVHKTTTPSMALLS